MLRPVFALVLLSLPVPEPAGLDTLHTAFGTTRPGEIAVPVTINDEGPHLFLLDTGSSHSVVSDRLAAAANAPTVARTVVTSPLGEEPRLVVRVDRLGVGPVFARGVLASVVSQSALDPAGKIRGILGQDVLAAQRYTLDFRNRRVLWHDASPPPAAGAWTTAMCFETGRFLVEFSQRSSILRLVPDSGSQGLVLFERMGRPLPSSFARLAPVELSTLGNRRAVRRASIDVLHLGGLTLLNVAAAIVPRPADMAHEGDGLLPLHIFERVTLDGPGRRLTISPPVAGEVRP